MAFRIGQKVICIDAEPEPGCRAWTKSEKIVRGQIYTIKHTHMFWGTPIVWLEEAARCRRAIKNFGPNVGYGAYRFRPVIERATDIEIFQRMLTPTDKVGAA